MNETFVVLRSAEKDRVLEHIISNHPWIQFTVEDTEANGSTTSLLNSVSLTSGQMEASLQNCKYPNGALKMPKLNTTSTADPQIVPTTPESIHHTRKNRKSHIVVPQSKHLQQACHSDVYQGRQNHQGPLSQP